MPSVVGNSRFPPAGAGAAWEGPRGGAGEDSTTGGRGDAAPPGLEGLAVGGVYFLWMNLVGWMSMALA